MNIVEEIDVIISHVFTPVAVLRDEASFVDHAARECQGRRGRPRDAISNWNASRFSVKWEGEKGMKERAFPPGRGGGKGMRVLEIGSSAKFPGKRDARYGARTPPWILCDQGHPILYNKSVLK